MRAAMAQEGAVQMMDLPTPTPGDSEALVRIDASATWMAELLEELQDVTRLEIGDIPPLQRQPTDLLATARRVAADFQKTTLAHEIRVASPQRTIGRTVPPAGSVERAGEDASGMSLMVDVTRDTQDTCGRMCNS